MFWDDEYIDEKIDVLKDMVENNTFIKDRCNNFISYDELEEEVETANKNIYKYH